MPLPVLILPQFQTEASANSLTANERAAEAPPSRVVGV